MRRVQTIGACCRVCSQPRQLLSHQQWTVGQLRERAVNLRAGRRPIAVRGPAGPALLRPPLAMTRVPAAEAVFADAAGFVVRDVVRETTGLAGGVILVACEWPHISG